MSLKVTFMHSNRVECNIFRVLPHYIPQVKRPLPLGVREDHFVLSWSEDWVQLNVSQSIHELSYWLKQGLCLSATVNGVRPQEMPDLDQSGGH